MAALLFMALSCRRNDDSPPPATTAPAASPIATAPPTATATFAVIASPTPATAPPEAAPHVAVPEGPQVITSSLTHNGAERSYRLYIPGSLTEAPVPLVIGLHGGFGSGEQFARTSRFDDAAESGRFIAVYPDGLGVVNTWNGGRCCGYAARQDVDDVGFIAALIDELSSRYPIDPGRIYATGTASPLSAPSPDRSRSAAARLCGPSPCFSSTATPTRTTRWKADRVTVLSRTWTSRRLPIRWKRCARRWVAGMAHPAHPAL
jgi:hypothetical protein